ncbi:unnamed protein product [Effrenium voratum]|nr:unnamed protein product [Effrenium voratum]
MLRLARQLPPGFALRSMLEPLLQELMEHVFCEWPRTLASLQDLKESEVQPERLGQLTTFAQMIAGYRAGLEETREAKLKAEAKEQSACLVAKQKSRAFQELSAQAKQLKEERDSCKKQMEIAQKGQQEAEEFFETFKQQTKLALINYSDMQYREATVKVDLHNLQVHCREKDITIADLRGQTTALTHENQDLEEKLMKVREEMERQGSEVEQLPALYEKLQYYESEEAVYGVSFARRVAAEVLGKEVEEIVGRFPPSMPMERKTQATMDGVLEHLRTTMRDAEKLKEQVIKLRQTLDELKQLVPIWNETTMHDVVDAFDEDSAVHRQVYTMSDKRSFAGLGLDESVPPYLRAEGFVRYRYISKKECEDIMEAFHAESPPDMNFQLLHQELHSFMQRRFSEEEFTEFAYAFICSLEAYRDDPDFELFDLMLAGAVHPSIMQDQENMLRELQALVHSCADGTDSGHHGRGGRLTGLKSGRDQVTRRVMRAVMQAMFPEKSVERMNALMRALHTTLQMLFDAGRSSNPDAAFVSDLFSASADGTQSPLIEEMRRQHLHEVLEFTAELSHALIRAAGGEIRVNIHGRMDAYMLISKEDTLRVLSERIPEIKSVTMVDAMWKIGEETTPYQVAEVLQKFRHNFLLKQENAWVVVGPKAVVEKALELGSGQNSVPEGDEEKETGQLSAKAPQPRRNRALKVLDNSFARDEAYTPQALQKEVRRSARSQQTEPLRHLWGGWCKTKWMAEISDFLGF